MENDFIPNANSFTDIQELTSENVHAFIPRYIYEKKEKSSRTEGTDVDIVFTMDLENSM